VRELLEAKDVARDEQSGKRVVLMDEMPWLDTAHSGFLEALDLFWNGWASAQDDILLIACGSATSWITKNLLNSHGGLYGRVTGAIWLAPFTLHETERLLQSHGFALSRREVMETYMVFGGVPYYLRLLNRRYALSQNIDLLCFARTGRLNNEFDALFRALFRHPERHIAVVRALATRQSGIDRAAILGITGLSDGGTFATTLAELEQCGLVRAYRDFTRDKDGEMYRTVLDRRSFGVRDTDADGVGWWGRDRKGRPTQHGRPSLFQCYVDLNICALLVHLVDKLLDTALALCSLVLVNDALRGGLVKLPAGSVCCGLCCVLVAILDGGANLLDIGLELGANRTIADAGLLGCLDALLLRLDVCHVLTLSVMNIEASTLRHGCVGVKCESIAWSDRKG
jgi:hypothetical protein